jgi:hypothetical protein
MFPYNNNNNIVANNNDPSPSVVTTSGVGSDIFLPTGTLSNLAIPASDVGRRRSGSVTQLSSSDTLPRPDFGNALFTPGFPPYHMMEENASDTVQSTLASLGLDDSHHTATATPTPAATPTSTSTSTTPSTTTSTTPLTTTASGSVSYLPSSNPPPAQQQQQRHRAYTVSTRNPTGDRLGDMLPMGFSPFSPQTRSSVMQRPRAVSLGMVDEPHFDDEMSSFTPFEMSSLQSTLPGTPAQQQQQQHHYNHAPSPSNHHHHYHHTPLHQQQQHVSPSRLDPQMLSETQRSLRLSRSSGNLIDLSSDRYSAGASRFDVAGLYDSNSMDDFTQQVREKREQATSTDFTYTLG